MLFWFQPALKFLRTRYNIRIFLVYKVFGGERTYQFKKPITVAIRKPKTPIKANPIAETFTTSQYSFFVGFFSNLQTRLYFVAAEDNFCFSFIVVLSNRSF